VNPVLVGSVYPLDPVLVGTGFTGSSFSRCGSSESSFSRGGSSESSESSFSMAHCILFPAEGLKFS
jgi:hypothetical protein